MGCFISFQMSAMKWNPFSWPGAGGESIKSSIVGIQLEADQILECKIIHNSLNQIYYSYLLKSTCSLVHRRYDDIICLEPGGCSRICF